MHKVRYFTKESLLSAAENAGVDDINSQIDTKRLAKMLDNTMLYPIIFGFVQNQTEMRCRVAINEQGESTFINVPIKIWQNLPLQEVAESAYVQADTAPVS
tara:strand:+ start:619 stop:921 length:303 start_codon:yes stop_codon:yes gene_type:complete